jgi:hypothetical protein
MTLRRRLAVAAACAVLFGICFAAGRATLDDEKPRDAGPARSASPPALRLALGRAAALPGLRTQPRPRQAAPYVPTVEEPEAEPGAAAPVPVPTPEPAAPPAPAEGGQLAPTPPPATSSPPRSAPAPDSPPRQPQPTQDAALSGVGGGGSYEEDHGGGGGGVGFDPD